MNEIPVFTVGPGLALLLGLVEKVDDTFWSAFQDGYLEQLRTVCLSRLP